MTKQTDKIRSQWESNGWYCINMIATNKNGIPDYLMKKKGEVDVFVESKESWDKLSKLQKARINELIDLGNRVFINDTEVVNKFVFDDFYF